eukprot:626078-Amphidinium_carterae.2
MTVTRHQGMQWVSKQQFECLRQALWTVQLGTVKDYNTSFWKEVARNGFDNYLTGIDEYENHSARSVRFVHDMESVEEIPPPLQIKESSFNHVEFSDSIE